MAKGGDTCCILNFKTKKVKEFRTLETDRELSYQYFNRIQLVSNDNFKKLETTRCIIVKKLL